MWAVIHFDPRPGHSDGDWIVDHIGEEEKDARRAKAEFEENSQRLAHSRSWSGWPYSGVYGGPKFYLLKEVEGA